MTSAQLIEACKAKWTAAITTCDILIAHALDLISVLYYRRQTEKLLMEARIKSVMRVHIPRSDCSL